MPPSFRRSVYGPKARCPRHAFRPLVQELEDRCLLAASVSAIDAIAVPLNIPAGKTLIVPLAAANPAAGGVTYTVTSSNAKVQVIPHPNNTFLGVSVAGTYPMRVVVTDVHHSTSGGANGGATANLTLTAAVAVVAAPLPLPVVAVPPPVPVLQPALTPTPTAGKGRHHGQHHQPSHVKKHRKPPHHPTHKHK
jgi:hypothetical protein